MYELAQVDFYKVKPLLEGHFLQPEMVSVIEGNNPGWIFVDKMDQPRTALVWSKGIQGFYLIGDDMNPAFIAELDDYINTHVAPRMREAGLDHFECSGQHDKWMLDVVFASRSLHPFVQLVFKLLQKPSAPSASGMKTINLKTDNWQDLPYSNLAFVKDTLELFWSSIDHFKEKGYGFAAIDGSEIIGVCYSSFVTKDTHAIGIETLPQHQKKGVGTHLSSLVVNEIAENGFMPYWDCSSDNEGSQKVALRIGLEQVHQYRCSSFSI
ncbi:GNAT family N-acetyltransferase [Paenibacillus algorifonticola]|uniref:GNAT family N-acetyltransferase n=1 Tax=Paenibacillus algorifonticola TaxID=684063 RepID=UPI003D2BC04B